MKDYFVAFVDSEGLTNGCYVEAKSEAAAVEEVKREYPFLTLGVTEFKVEATPCFS